MPTPRQLQTQAVGRLLRDARRQAGLTQQDVAGEAGIPQSYVSDVERGRVTPTIPTISRIAAAAGRTVTLALSPENTTRKGATPMSVTIERGTVITEAERRRRIEDMNEAIHSIEMEGGRVSAETQADMLRCAHGEIDYQTLLARVQARHGVA